MAAVETLTLSELPSEQPSVEGSLAESQINATEREIPSLPAVDTSKEAWAYVAAGFMLEMLLWGPMFSTAVYLKYYAESPVRSFFWFTWRDDH